jgi:hypothetical protein
MGEEKRRPGRPRKWASDAERMRATRAAQRAQREAASRQAGKGSCDTDRRRGEVPVPFDSPVASANQPPASAVAPEPIADHKACEAAIRALRSELVNLEERYDDLVLSRWIISRKCRKFEHALGKMRSHDPAGIVWLVERLAEWERDVEAKRTKRLHEPHRELVRRRYAEEFDRRLELARRQSQQ